MATYDDWRLHRESPEYPEALPDEHAFHHIGLYLLWLIERGLASDDLLAGWAEHAQLSTRYLAGEIEFAEVSAELMPLTGGAIGSEQLSEEGEQFTALYYEEQFPHDWSSVLFYEAMTSPYDVIPSSEHAEELFERIDEHLAAWRAGDWVAPGEYDGTVRLWDIEDLEQSEQLLGSSGELAALSPDGLRMATADSEGAISVFEAATGALLGELDGHAGEVTCLVFSPPRPDNRALLGSAGLDGTVRLWDAESGEELLTFEGGEEIVETLEFSADGARLLTVGHPLESLLDEESLEQLYAFQEAMTDDEEDDEDDAV